MALRRRRGLPELIALPLRLGERNQIAGALAKADLPTEDLDMPGRLFWRFETPDQVPLGFGGLEIHSLDALMRSVLTLPPARKRGVGSAMVAALEVEALALKASTVWLITTSAAGFFERLGYAPCDRADIPHAIRQTRQFSSLCPDTAAVMCKRLR